MHLSCLKSRPKGLHCEASAAMPGTDSETGIVTVDT